MVALDAQNWALAVTRWKYPGASMHNDRADSFRHCVWTGQWLSGSVTSAPVAAWHEVKEGQPAREYNMDVANNAIGLMAGSIVNRNGGADTWGWVLNRCKQYERADELHGLGGVRGQYSPQ